jgi:hypothetical protein
MKITNAVGLTMLLLVAGAADLVLCAASAAETLAGRTYLKAYEDAYGKYKNETLSEEFHAHLTRTYGLEITECQTMGPRKGDYRPGEWEGFCFDKRDPSYGIQLTKTPDGGILDYYDQEVFEARQELYRELRRRKPESSLNNYLDFYPCTQELRVNYSLMSVDTEGIKYFVMAPSIDIEKELASDYPVLKLGEALCKKLIGDCTNLKVKVTYYVENGFDQKLYDSLSYNTLLYRNEPDRSSYPDDFLGFYDRCDPYFAAGHPTPRVAFQYHIGLPESFDQLKAKAIESDQRFSRYRNVDISSASSCTAKGWSTTGTMTGSDGKQHTYEARLVGVRWDYCRVIYQRVGIVEVTIESNTRIIPGLVADAEVQFIAPKTLFCLHYEGCAIERFVLYDLESGKTTEAEMPDDLDSYFGPPSLSPSADKIAYVAFDRNGQASYRIRHYPGLQLIKASPMRPMHGGDVPLGQPEWISDQVVKFDTGALMEDADKTEWERVEVGPQ